MSLVKRNAEILLGTEFLTRLLLFFVVVQLMNSLGDERYGQLAYIFAIANLCIVLADFGIHTYVTRLLAQSSAAWLAQRRAIITLKLIGSMVAWILTILIVSLTNNLSILITVTGALAIIATSGRIFSEAIVRGQQQMRIEAYSKIIHAILQGVALLIAISLTTSLLTIVLVYMVTAIVGWWVSIWLVRQPLFEKFTGQRKVIKFILTAIIPFATSVAINAQFNYFDSAVLGWLYPKEVVGWYSAAYKPIFFLTAIAGLIITAFFPRIVELWTKRDINGVHLLIRRLLTMTISLALPMAIIGSFVAPWIIRILYKPEYAPATLPLIILLWSTVCIYIWAPLGNSLQACGYEKLYMKNFIIAAVINIPLTISLVWQYSLIGAAVATAITQLILVLLMAKDARLYLWKKTV